MSVLATWLPTDWTSSPGVEYPPTDMPCTVHPDHLSLVGLCLASLLLDTTYLLQVRGALRRTRGALAATAETAAVRWRRLKRIEGGGDARRR